MKIKVSVSTNKEGSKCIDEVEIDEAEWSSMTEDQKETLARDTMFNMIEWHYTVEE